MRSPAPQQHWNEPLARVMDLILNCTIRFKTAAEVGKRAVFYCRGEDLFNWMMDNREMLVKKFPDALDGQPLETPTDVTDFCNKLIRYGFMYRAQYKPIDGVIEQDDEGRYKRPKWPKRLGMTPKQTFDSQAFYVVVYEGSKSWQHFILFCIIAAVLCVCMFPAWPLKLKVAVWYLSVVFLTLILVMVFVRLIIYVFFWFFGFQVWFLPNLFNEDAGFVESFQPWLEAARSDDDWAMFAARIFCAILTAGTLYKLSETHSPASVANFAKQSFLDVLDWGHQRLAAPPGGYSKYASITDKQEGTPEGGVPEGEEGEATPSEPKSGDEEDYSCLKTCGFVSFEHLMQSRCLVKCKCMQEVLESKCFPNCPEATQAALKEAANDACDEEQKRKKKKF
ncbi:translocation protein sec62 [Cystoisospora suis]|uniref:Translocation protein SEC62 n=1 Tax=Cystoisospora suis TaxID=483139 RepID=A0A2C6LDR8_9APIC|nr:translocation protein sec62 [Cystoisospora suis]